MITSIELPDALTEIPAGAFMSCQNLESIVIPASIKTIGSVAFEFCTKLETVTFKSSTELTISGYAFYVCQRLKNVIFENDTRLIIDSYAFDTCSRLKSIVLPESIVSIASAAFNNCSDDLTVYVRAESIPQGTDEWMADVKEVIRGYKEEE